MDYLINICWIFNYNQTLFKKSKFNEDDEIWDSLIDGLFSFFFGNSSFLVLLESILVLEMKCKKVAYIIKVFER